MALELEEAKVWFHTFPNASIVLLELDLCLPPILPSD